MDTAAKDIPPQASRLAPKLRALADHGVFFGTSSWKYDGWVGSIYSGDRYVTRGKFSKAKFEDNCLTEYAQTFPTVCGDLTFYQFPTEQYGAKLFDATPRALRSNSGAKRGRRRRHEDDHRESARVEEVGICVRE